MQFGKMERNLNNMKVSLYPTAPLTAQGVSEAFENSNVMAKYGTSKIDNSGAFYRGTVLYDRYKFSVFASPTILAKVEGLSDRQFHIDATFKVVPNGEFNQLLVFHINYDEHAFPCIYVLMKGRTQDAYIRLLQYIEENVCQLKPKSFTSDYEAALRNALRSVYPLCEVSGCYFYYCQAIKKNACQIPNFLTLLQENGNAKKLYHKFLALPLLRLDKIPEASLSLIAEGSTIGGAFTQFIGYFQRKWIRREGASSFCVFRRVSRTNNLVESHNSRLRAKIHVKRNIFKFLDYLLDEDVIKSRELSQVMAGGDQVYCKQRLATKRRNARIQALQAKLDNGLISVDIFLNKVTFFDNKLMDDMTELPVVNADPVVEIDDDVPDNIEFPEPTTVADLQRQLQNVNSTYLLDVNCGICKEERKSRLLLPCSHVSLCSLCCDTLEARGNMTCPLCRTPVISNINVFI